MQPRLTDQRSVELLQTIENKIDLADDIIFTNSLIDIPYRINGKRKGILLESPIDIAAFAAHNNIITRYEKCGEDVKMYTFQILPATDRRGYPYQCIAEVEVKKIPTLFSRDEIKAMVARYEYDFGSIDEVYNDLFAPKGKVIEMYPSNSNKPTKRTA